MVKLGVLADIHGNVLALAAVLEHARRQGVDLFVDLGDVLSGPLWPRETFELHRQAPIMAGIRGNNDRQEDWPSLPPTAIVDGELFLCHGSPESDTAYLLEDVSSGHAIVRSESEILELLAGVREPIVLCGHTHMPRVVRLSNGQLIVNPGSVGLPAYDDVKPVKHVMETYSPHASYAVLEKSDIGWDVTLHRVVYDWNKAAQQARSLGRKDWACGLECGRMDAYLREQSCIP